jgi:hypothetical protein
MHYTSFAAATLMGVLMVSAPALAGERAPTAEERAKIESSLTAAGFTAWKELELDDGKWEVDDAVGADGKTYDVELDPATFNILARELDD